ncbi:hypothetical protein TIFTF001_021284 [Ficus carica]|uniref:Uncharacterized protein n=1 Tax=Ficus carica TaxID=3494 RepID=A0AA88AFM3_FICCA|nr:hypothetical protein TIFTF001_021284 [Ficus carica]
MFHIACSQWHRQQDLSQSPRSCEAHAKSHKPRKQLVGFSPRARICMLVVGAAATSKACGNGAKTVPVAVGPGGCCCETGHGPMTTLPSVQRAGTSTVGSIGGAGIGIVPMGRD